MSPRYRNIAVIGTGPSGISAIRALNEEKVFDTIRVFERRDQPGGLWHYDKEPDPFPGTVTEGKSDIGRNRVTIPSKLPQFTPTAPEDLSARTGMYEPLDSNIAAEFMAFTHTPMPEINSAASVEQIGLANPTRPFRVVLRYLQDLVEEYLPLILFNTTVEKVEKTVEKDGYAKWTLTLRRSGQVRQDQPVDYWWQEKFDAVVVASGHYYVPLIPNIAGLEETAKSHPWVLEHSKSFRSADNYVGKRVVVVGASISAAGLTMAIRLVVRGPLILSQRHGNRGESLWAVSNVICKPGVKSIIADSPSTVRVTFTDGSTVDHVDRVIFGTGYRTCYPFLSPDPVTLSNRLAGFYQHVFKIGDPSLAVVGQLKYSPFRAYQYQAVAVARYFAGREAKSSSLPSVHDQEEWETKRVESLGPGSGFHAIREELKEYFDFLRNFAGPADPASVSHELPPFEDAWLQKALHLLQLYDTYWKSLAPKPLNAKL